MADQEPVRPDIWGDPPPQPGGSVPVGRLDPALDPDRYRPEGLELPWETEREDPASARGGRTLPGLLGDGAHEDERDNAAWAVGLIGMLVFLGLVAFLFGSVLSP